RAFEGKSMNLLPGDFSYGAIGLAVTDLDRSLDYYQRRIGLELLEREGPRAVLGAAGRRLVELQERPKATRDPKAADLFHFALLLPSRAALARSLAKLIETDTDLSGAADHFVSEALYLRDPDGHGIELYRDRPPETWYRDGKLHMGTVALDLDDLLQAAHGHGEDARGLAPGTAIGHMHLETFDLQRSKSFYVDRLGMAVTTEGKGATFMAVGGYHHHLAANVWGRKTHPAPRDGGHIGMLWFEMELPGRQDLAALAEGLGQGEPADDALVVEDPNGLTIRFVARA
ncbi:MAG TPA: VOC family protein, partial [Geminicoccaceae bacterium]|nr:VOC family protein [Geminicoccaceae bacterium]